MIHLPNDILYSIFSFLSQRYLSKCATVCKAWWIETRQPQYYKTITIYSKAQLNAFMEAAVKIKITEKNIPFGHFVQELFVHEDCYGCILNDLIVLELYQCCPNMKKINDTETYACCPALGYKNTSDNLFYKRENTYPDTLDTILHDYSSIVHTNPSLFIHQGHHTFKSLKYSINYRYNPYDIIQTQIQSQKYKNQTNSYAQDDNDHEDKVCFKKLIHFSSSVSWIQLKELYLNFDELNKKVHTNKYQLDDCVLETITSTCPQLESLTMDCLDMCAGNANDHSYKTYIISIINNKLIQPHSSLKQLRLNGCYIEYIFFNYFNRMFPNIIDLNLGLYWDKDKIDKEEDECYKQSLYRMMTSFIHLKKISTNLKTLIYFHCGETRDHISLYGTKLWPNDQLYEWLKNNPKQLEVLKTSFDFGTILNSIDSIINAAKSTSSTSLMQDNHYKYIIYDHLAFLRHLTTLCIFWKTTKYRQDILRCLRSDNLNFIVSTSITSLTIHTFEDILFLFLRCTPEYDDSKMDDFYIDDWLMAFPNLKKLDLSFPFKVHLSKKSMITNHPSSPSSSLLLHQRKSVYPLKELKMQGVYIHLSINDLKELLESCPSLRILSFVKVVFKHTITINQTIPPSSTESSTESSKSSKPLFLSPLLSSLFKSKSSKSSGPPITINKKMEINNELKYFIIDAPHLNLDKLELLYIDQYGYKKDSQRLQKKLKVNEIGLNNSFQCVATSFSYPPLNIIINCKSIDVIHFKDN
ncbi:unnamed protein product [Cunninghamella blakesleeana]